MPEPYYDPGFYKMENISIGVAEPPGKAPFFYIQGNIVGRANGSEVDYFDAEGVQVRDVRFYMSPKARTGSMKALRGMGFNGDFANPSLLKETMENGLVVECTHEEYNGKLHERWGIGGGKQPAPQSTLEKLNKFWADKVETADAGPPSDDDLPF